MIQLDKTNAAVLERWLTDQGEESAAKLLRAFLYNGETPCERCDANGCTDLCAKGAMWWPTHSMPPGPLAAALLQAADQGTRHASIMRQAAAFIEDRIRADAEAFDVLLVEDSDIRE